MNIFNSLTAPYRLPILFVVVLSLILVFIIALPSSLVEIESIPRLYTLKVKNEYSTIIESHLQEKNIRHYSLYNQLIPQNSYAFTKNIYLHSYFNERQIFSEPQERFLANLKNLFNDGEWEIFFIDAKKSPISYYLDFKHILGEKNSFYICGFSPFQFLYSFFISLIFYSLIFFLFPKYRLWCYLGFPLNLFLVYKGSFFILLSNYLLWGSLLFYFLCHLDKWKKSFKLGKGFLKADFQKLVVLLFVLIIPTSIFFLVLNPLPSHFLVLMLIVLYYIVATIFYLYHIYNKAVGVGFSGFLLEPILAKRRLSSNNFLQLVSFFLFMMLFASGLFFTLSTSSFTYGVKNSLSINLNNQKRISNFLTQHRGEEDKLLHGIFYCLYSNYQDFRLEGITYNNIVNSIIKGEDIVWQEDVASLESEKISLEYNRVDKDIILSSWHRLIKESTFKGLLFFDNKMVGLSREKNLLLIRKFILLGFAAAITFIDLLFLYFLLVPFNILYQNRVRHF